MSLAKRFIRHPQKIWLRRALFQIHLWTGIAMGLYVIAICVSGSALFFRNAVMESAPGRRVVQGSGPLLTKDQLTEIAKRTYSKYEITSVSLGSEPGLEVEVVMYRNGSRRQRIIDPYTGKDIGPLVPYTLQAITFFLNLHANLMGGSTGRMWNGVFAIFLTVVCITGAIIWWPGLSKWRKSLTVNPRAKWKRLNWELHSSVGFWTFSIVFMWSITGVFLVFPNPFLKAVDFFLPLDFYKPFVADSEIGRPAPKPDAVKFVRVADVEAPKAPPPAPKARRRRPPPHYSAGDQIFRVSYSAHFGNFAGMKTRILWAILGLMPVFLFITGTIMWWNRVLSKEARKLRRRRGKAIRELASAQTA